MVDNPPNKAGYFLNFLGGWHEDGALRFLNDNVDGSKIRRSPVDMVNISLFTGF